MSIRDARSNDKSKQSQTQRFQLDGSVLGEFFKHRLQNDRDAKVIITSRSSSTGLGKTTLAILLAKWIDKNWDAESKAFLDVSDYINRYLEVDEGTCLLLDEIEHGADNRRAMSSENVNLSKAWATLRFRNVVTISTLPTTSMLDSRMLELADVWINVMSKGVAMPYFLWVNDYTGKIHRVPVKHPKTGQKELLHWNPIEDDEDYNILKRKKSDGVFSEPDKTYTKDQVESAKRQAKKQKRNELIETLDNKTNLSQSDIGELVELQQQTISQILRNQKNQ